MIDFSLNYFATEGDQVHQYSATINAWTKKIAFNFKPYKFVKEVQQVSNSGAVLAKNGVLLLSSGKQVPVDPISTLSNDCVVFHDLMIPLVNMVPYQHDCNIKLICQSGSGANETWFYLYDDQQNLSIVDGMGQRKA